MVGLIRTKPNLIAGVEMANNKEVRVVGYRVVITSEFKW